ncbi:uncharacterized protein LOC144103893 [Amblyomma americanum]
MQAATEDEFRTLLDAFMAWCEEEGDTNNGLGRFNGYFKGHYGQRPEVWASCFRKAAGINTNMRLEALHRVLKYVYLDGKQNRRIDNLVSILINLTRDKIFDRLIKLERNKDGKFQKETRDRHKIGQLIPSAHVASAGIQQWLVRSQATPTTSYVVTALHSGTCNEQCAFRCPTCHICVHNVTCSCPDNTMRRNLCKHAHAVFKGGAEDGARNTPSPNEDPTAQEAEDSLTASLTSLGSLKEKATMKSPTRCLQLLDTIRGHLQDTEPDEEVITWLEPLLEKTAEKLNIASAHLPQSSVQANKKIDPQRRFISTKRKRASGQAKMAKPSRAEQEDIEQTLMAPNSVSHKGPDHTYCTKPRP